MPYTEFVIPSLKQDEGSKAAFLSASPLLISGLAKASGFKQHVIGTIISENGEDVNPNSLKIALGIEWEQEKNLYDFLVSEDFKAFAVHAKSFSAAPPDPQLYKTDLEPTAIFTAPLTEVIRIPMEEGQAGEVQLIWKQYIDAIESKENIQINALCGTSLNLEKKHFVGIVGYRGIEMRESIHESLSVGEAKGKLEKLGANSFVVSFSKP
ncbi:uncharacterized protein LY89DRAFT_685553 [Mollisia scopiformis]|uniref:Uncharacterized protein n=1 Tax=Mollisia scopiformis TaxID=149040 RepID=A0A194X902_MOLSC|nr:uncharacterized protein LY89DRAFT_685553 [Mollisia scopiformis]KUJ16650.1 hypothetical protein LY89DRAFT_685553 [Mollisia scopiformis]